MTGDELLEIKDVLEKGESAKNYKINVIGRVVSIRDDNVKLSDGKSARVLRIIIGDGTGFIRVSVWRPKQDIQKGNIVKVINPIVNLYNGRIELSTGYTTRVIVEPKNDPRYNDIPSFETLLEQFKSITSYPLINLEDIRDYDGKVVNVVGTVMSIYTIRVREPRDENDNETLILVGGIDDETGYSKFIVYGDTVTELTDVTLEEVKDVYTNRVDEIDSLVTKVLTKLGGKEVSIIGRVRIRDDIPENLVRERIYVRQIEEVDPSTVKKVIDNGGDNDE